MTVENFGAPRQGRPRRSTLQEKGFVQFLRMTFKGDRPFALFRLSGLQPGAQFFHKEVDCSAYSENTDQAKRAGFRLLRGYLSQIRGELGGEERWKRQRLEEMLASLADLERDHFEE